MCASVWVFCSVYGVRECVTGGGICFLERTSWLRLTERHEGALVGPARRPARICGAQFAPAPTS